MHRAQESHRGRRFTNPTVKQSLSQSVVQYDDAALRNRTGADDLQTLQSVVQYDDAALRNRSRALKHDTVVGNHFFRPAIVTFALGCMLKTCLKHEARVKFAHFVDAAPFKNTRETRSSCQIRTCAQFCTLQKQG